VPVLLPAFSKKAREGGDLKAAFLFAIEHLTVLLWPALAIVALLTRPLVEILVGHQWLATIPMIEVIAVSYIFCFMMNLPNPLLIAAGAVRDTVLIALLIVPITVAIQVGASFFGLQAVAWSFLATNFYVAVVSLLVLRRRIPFGWGEIVYALRKSAIVTVMSAAVPLATVISVGGVENVTIPEGIFAGCAAGLAWLLGIAVTRHPILGELERLISAGMRTVPATAVLGQFAFAKRSSPEKAPAVGTASVTGNINPSAGD
jgi:O-antigen/teichoic acid export membrane protein